VFPYLVPQSIIPPYSFFAKGERDLEPVFNPNIKRKKKGGEGGGQESYWNNTQGVISKGGLL